ncbi:MAG TPA: cytochrome C oxidase subunit IV family protein [Candidatus Binataceae bacterium]|nr:cytochrome C oxidase subunit IV family protein [Candidatus Binataceae bacterium]
MSSEHAIEHGHGGVHHAVEESHHPTANQYLVIALILTVLTVAEIGVYYVPALQPLLVPLLLILSFCKFVLVAAYYMHLHFDSRVFSVLFIFPLMLACLILASLTMLLSYLAHHPGP